MQENPIVRDAMLHALDMARGFQDSGVGVGYGVATLRDGDGKIKLALPFHNLITDAGDLYHVAKIITGISPATPAAPTAMSGMKLGTGTTAVAKSGAGAAIVTYITASNQPFASTFPQPENLGGGLGVNAYYRSVWAAGVATNAAIAEVVICNDAGTNATSTAANTCTRALFGTAINKAAGDALTVDWKLKQLGA